MAVGEYDKPTTSTGRKWMVGTNVLVMIALVVGIVVVCQLLAFRAGKRWDMTSAGVNSLSHGTENLLATLDTNIRLTSLYFESDLDEEDQQRYRSVAHDLLDLYEATNRGKIARDWINPIKDQAGMRKLRARLLALPAFKEQVDAHQARIDKYLTQVDGEIRTLIQAESDKIASFGGAMGDTSSNRSIAAIENLFLQLGGALDRTREQIEAMTPKANPQYAAAINELRTLYGEVGKWLKDLGRFGPEQAANDTTLPPNQADYLRTIGNRCASVVASIEAETTMLEELDLLKVEDILRQLGPTNNAILVETDSDAKVVDFASVWPPINDGMGGRARFEQRAFKGEERLTSAILRVTHKEQTAVVFVRFGGAPAFQGRPLPGQPPAPYTTMKRQLEDANFIVEEWDLKSTKTPPAINPAPTQTLFVVLKPFPPQRSAMGQPSQEPPFSDIEKQAVVNAIGDSGGALFVAGWAPGPFGPIATPYEYGDYLKDEWGIEVDHGVMLVKAIGFAPGKYGIDARSFFNTTDVDLSDHPIVKTASGSLISLPWCAPLRLTDSAPEGVTRETLVTRPAADGVWGVKSIQKYQQQLDNRDYLVKEEDDLEGPFDLAVAATKGDAKVVVVSSRDFATDSIAFARRMEMGAKGITVRSVNPDNVSLLINSLHWLNDNSEFMNIGKPIDSAVLNIENATTEKAVQVVTIFVWPALALCMGGVAWFVRRR